MAKYHVNPDTGKAGVCTAAIRCRFGLELNDHYSSAQEAMAAYEETQASNLFGETTLTKKKKFVASEYIMDYINSSSPEVIQEAKSLIDYASIEDYAGEISFKNREGNYISLEDMQNVPSKDPQDTKEIANLLREELKFDMKSNNISMDTIRVAYSNGDEHWANKMTMPNGDVVILDYSANQYDKSIKTPLVLGVKDWAKMLNERVKVSSGAEITKESLDSLISKRKN